MPNPAQAKRTRGAPRKPKDMQVTRFNLSLPPDLKQKLEKLGGGDWLRERIKEARL